MSCSEAFQGMEMLKLLELVLLCEYSILILFPVPPHSHSPSSLPIVAEKISRIRIKLITTKTQLNEIIIYPATCFDPIEVFIRLISKTYEVYTSYIQGVPRVKVTTSGECSLC